MRPHLSLPFPEHNAHCVLSAVLKVEDMGYVQLQINLAWRTKWRLSLKCSGMLSMPATLCIIFHNCTYQMSSSIVSFGLLCNMETNHMVGLCSSLLTVNRQRIDWGRMLITHMSTSWVHWVWSISTANVIVKTII